MAWQNPTTNALRYRLKNALMLLAFGDNHDEALPALPGKVIEVRSLPEDDRFVVVSVDGQEFHAFASDLHECCEPLPNFAPQRVQQRLTAAA